MEYKHPYELEGLKPRHLIAIILVGWLVCHALGTILDEQTAKYEQQMSVAEPGDQVVLHGSSGTILKKYLNNGWKIVTVTIYETIIEKEPLGEEKEQ